MPFGVVSVVGLGSGVLDFGGDRQGEGNLTTQKFPREFPGILGIATWNFFVQELSSHTTLQLCYI